MRNVLYFAKDADERVAFPDKNLRFITTESDTNVAVYFSGDDGGAGSLNLTVTSGKADEVVKEISRIAISGQGVVTIFDADNNIKAVDGIEAIAAVTISA